MVVRRGLIGAPHIVQNISSHGNFGPRFVIGREKERIQAHMPDFPDTIIFLAKKVGT